MSRCLDDEYLRWPRRYRRWHPLHQLRESGSRRRGRCESLLRRVLDNVSDDGQRTTMKVALWLRVAVRLVDVVLIVAVWNAGLVQMLCFLLLPVGKLGIGRLLDGVVSFMLVGVSRAVSGRTGVTGRNLLRKLAAL
jgi:hypothetical protein